MLRAIRRKLRQIRYYSAPRRRDRATVLFERAGLLALVLCLPAAVVVDRTVRKPSPTAVIEGRLVVDRAGTYHASLVDVMSSEVDPIWSRGEPVAEFDITLGEWRYGWPIHTSRSRAPAQLVYTPFDQRTQSATALASDAGAREAVEQAIRSDRPRLESAGPGASTFSWSESERAHSPLGWVYATFIWFVLLFAIIVGPLVLIEFLMNVHRATVEARDLTRRERGLCTACGYDLTGNAFSERCPECGELV